MQSIPSIMAEPRTKLATIAGSIPHPYARPQGCPFHPRCTEKMPGICDAGEPELQTLSPGRAVSCFLYENPTVVLEPTAEPDVVEQ